MKKKTNYFIIGLIFWISVLVLTTFWIVQLYQPKQKKPEVVYYLKKQANQNLIKSKQLKSQILEKTIREKIKKNKNEKNKNRNGGNSLRSLENKFKKGLKKISPIQNKKNKQKKISAYQYWVQIAAYSKKNGKLANQTLDKLAKKQIDGRIIGTNSKKLKLVVGPFDDLNQANIEKNRLTDQIKDLGITKIFVYRQKNKSIK